ncbi:MAG: alanine racemase [Eubacterium sp.]|nr:alanine racemase [Eubacterium sp.]
MYKYTRAEAVINLDAIKNNMEEMKALINKETKIAAVIKADGYGHGAIEIANEIEGLDYLYGFATATFDEALSLRNQGIKKPVFILGHVFKEHYTDAVKNEIALPVFSLETAKDISDAAKECVKEAHIHIVIDTGMSRIGYRVTDDAADEIEKISHLPGIVIDGAFTHFYMSDAYDKTSAHKQYEKYMEMMFKLGQRGVDIPIKHVSNSAAIVDMPEVNLDMVRAGITLYGLWPSDEVDKTRIYLEPVMSLYARVTHVKTIHKGDVISYGGTYEAKEDRRIATIGFGYADGYPRGLSNKGWVIINGKKAPIRGRVCMDQFMVDVTDIDDVEVGTEVTLIGRDRDECITMELLGELSGRFNYELACDITKRVPRVFVKDDKMVSSRDYF